MNTTGTLALLGGGAGLGAGLMYLLDPKDGRRRRAITRDKAVHAYHVSSKVLRRSGIELTKRSRGLRRSSVELAKRSQGLVADATSVLQGKGISRRSITERVRAKLGRSHQRQHSLSPAASLIAGTASGALALAGLVGLVRSTGATTAFARR